jgi:hypothetical protein
MYFAEGIAFVTPVTLPCESDYCGPSATSAFCKLAWRYIMQRDLRDCWELLEFDVMEETVGTCLRAIICHFGKEQNVLEIPNAKMGSSPSTYRLSFWGRSGHPSSSQARNENRGRRRRSKGILS